MKIDPLTRLREIAPIELPEALYSEIVHLHETPPRAYHSINHVLEILQWFVDVDRNVGWRAPAEIFLAMLFHDAVYIAGASDNELRSAEMARSAIERYRITVDADRVAQLIALTAGHGSRRTGALDSDAALFLDCDMAILGAESARFAQYDAQIAVEYGALSPDQFRAGRRAFLEKLRNAPRIYLTDTFDRNLGWRARANLTRALGLAEVVQAGDPVLRARAHDVDTTLLHGAEMQALFRRMIDAMRAAPGVGLAAPQLGIPLRVLVLEDRPEYLACANELELRERGRVAVGPRVFVNPTLSMIGDVKVGFFEGCLSVDGFVGYVDRWDTVEVSGLDEHGESQTWRVSGWPARILQHELDHLEGTLYIDRMQTRTFSTVELAAERFAGRSAAEVRALLAATA